jgi:hypothetical protein
MSIEAKGPLQACKQVAAPAGTVVATAGAGPRRWDDADGKHIDVRGLEPPQPLVAILRLVHEQRDAGAAVIVHHDRDPALLYPELAELGWSAQRIDGAPGEVRLRLVRDC